jgi:N-acetylmuramoyl-L-alanine amidase
MKANEFLICLDAGHGGMRNGTGPEKYVTYPSKCYQHRTGKFHSYGWFFEGVFNRSLANYLEQYLLDYGFKVKKIYEPINDTTLNKRCQLANSYASVAKHSVLVSIHGNAAAATTARGWEIFTSPGQTKADLLATCIGEQVKNATPGWVHRADYLDGDLDREARFTMLTNVSMPAVLSENGFFTNYSDAGLMIDLSWQQSIAKAHAKGILDYAVQQGVVWE